MTVHEYVLQQTGATLKAKIQAAAASLFSANLGFPTVLPQSEFCYKLLLYYIDHGFCREDLELWGLEADSTLQGLLEKYKGILESEAWEYEPLTNYDLNTTRSGSMTGSQSVSGTTSGSHSDTESRRDQESHGDTTQTTKNGSNTTSGTSHSTSTKESESHDTVKKSDTPQGAISGLTSGNYMSEASITDSESEDHTSGDDTRTETSSNSENGADVRTGQHASQGEATRSGTQSQETESTTESSQTTGGSDYVTGYSGISPQRLTAEYREILDTYVLKMIKDCAILFNLVFDVDKILEM